MRRSLTELSVTLHIQIRRWNGFGGTEITEAGRGMN